MGKEINNYKECRKIFKAYSEHLIEQYGMVIVAGALQDTAADLLKQSAGEDFKQKAVDQFAARVMGGQAK